MSAAMMPSCGIALVSRSANNWWPALALAAGCALQPAAATPLLAQPVVQPLPANPGTLNGALARLARDPRDLTALIDAGNAALQMGDVDAAVGFFARADQLSPNNMRVKAGLAGALVRSENPFDAIPLFAEAEKAGVVDPLLLSDRGLAYDLVGDNATAQRYYRQALAAGPNDETVRRLALSQAIAGDRAGMELVLSPLLVKQDKAAWRARAFALAILNRPDEAITIANQSMPADLASGISPYLRYMPRLTPAQQAAAANFGRFPRAAEIGRDDPRVALYAPPRRAASADAGLVPAGEPLGKGRSRRDRQRASVAVPPVLASAAPARSAPPEPVPVRQVASAPALAAAAPQPAAPARPFAAQEASAAPAAPPVLRSAPSAPGAATSLAGAPALAAAPMRPSAELPPVGASVPPAAASGMPVRSALAPSPVGASVAPNPARPSAAPGVDPARATPAPSAQPAARPVPVLPAPAAPAPTVKPRAVQPTLPAPVARPAPLRPARVADAFADLAVPSGPAGPAPGAVDVRKIAAAKPKPVEPPKPVHPSRIWVQVGTGRDPKALAFTWRGLVKANPDLFRGKSATMSDWGRTNRLLTGPFASESAAGAFLARLRKNDIDAFVWTSPAGQVVDDLPGK